MSRHVDCPFSATIEFAADALAQSPEIEVSPVEGVAERVSVASSVVHDASDTVRKHEALLVAWRPRHRGLFPDLHGVLTVRPDDRGSKLSLEGEYTPPLGAAGRLFDALLGRVVAQRTLGRFLRHLCKRIERRWNAPQGQA